MLKDAIHNEHDEHLETIINELPKQRVKKPRGAEREHYLNQKEFEQHIREFYETGIFTNFLGDAINKIATGLSYKPNFINYTFREEFIGDAIIKMYNALITKKFILDKNYSSLGYFTTIAWRAFINRIKKEKKHHQTLCDYRDKCYGEELSRYSEQGGHIYIKPEYKEEELESLPPVKLLIDPNKPSEESSEIIEVEEVIVEVPIVKIKKIRVSKKVKDKISKIKSKKKSKVELPLLLK